MAAWTTRCVVEMLTLGDQPFSMMDVGFKVQASQALGFPQIHYPRHNSFQQACGAHPVRAMKGKGEDSTGQGGGACCPLMSGVVTEDSTPTCHWLAIGGICRSERK